MNPDAVGTVYPAVDVIIDPKRVAAFRSLFGIADGVPPTFVTAAEFAALPQVVADPNLALDFTRVVHGSQEYEFRRPLREGETVSVRARIESIRQKGDSGFVTIVMDLIDVDGELVCTARSQMVERGRGA
jgi:acyl dehydratase